MALVVIQSFCLKCLSTCVAAEVGLTGAWQTLAIRTLRDPLNIVQAKDRQGLPKQQLSNVDITQQFVGT